MLHAFALTLLALMLMQITPGPNLVAIASAAFSSGRHAAYMVVLGIASGAGLWVMAIALGLGAVLEAYPILIPAMKVAGGGYLLLIGYKTLRSVWGGTQSSDLTQSGGDTRLSTPTAHFKRGLLVVITNPKVALGWVAAASYLFGAGLTSWQVAAFAPVAALSAITIYGGYAYLFSIGSAISIYRRFWRFVDGLFGGVFSALGAALLVDGIRQLRS